MLPDLKEYPVATKIVPEEESKRVRLLSTVHIDKNGVAHCNDLEFGTETSLAGITIDAQKTTALTAFEYGRNNHLLQFPIGSKDSSRIGFIIGHKALSQISAVLRRGLFSGTPLVRGVGQEAYVALEGIKPEETDEHKWALEVGAFRELGFITYKSRVVCHEVYKSRFSRGIWNKTPLVVSPENIGCRFQILCYSTTDQFESYFPYDILRGEIYNREVKRFNGLRINYLTGAFEVAVACSR